MITSYGNKYTLAHTVAITENPVGKYFVQKNEINKVVCEVWEF